MAGLLWTIFLWLLLVDEIPSRANAVGFTEQVYGLSAYLVGTTTLLLGSTLVFVLGALANAAVVGSSQMRV